MAIHLDVSQLNIVIAILGFFVAAFGIISVKFKNHWFLGEAFTAFVFGAIMGPQAIVLLDSSKWGSAIVGQLPYITLGLTRIVIGLQLVIAGYQLPARYIWYRWREMTIALLGFKTLMWLCTTGCMMLLVPNITLLDGLALASLVTSTDPVLSQAIAKGPFADKYVRRNLRELISAEAGANDGFGLPFLTFGMYLIRHAESAKIDAEVQAFEESKSAGVVRALRALIARAGEESKDLGRVGGGTGAALKNWFLETWGYSIIMSIAYGAVVGLIMLFAARIASRRKLIEVEAYLLLPTAIGLFIVGTCGLVGTNDILACFAAGTVLNWDGEFLKECQAKHDSVNSVIDFVLNLGSFAYIGMIMPWQQFVDFGIPRLVGLGFAVVVFRRIPAVLATYKLMPSCVQNWREALFLGYFSPIGIGAVLFVEHARHLFPYVEDAQTEEERQFVRLMYPITYWLIFFSIIWHGLSIPALNAFYVWRKVPPVEDEDGPVEIRLLSENDPLPSNAVAGEEKGSAYVHNRFSRACNTADFDLRAVELNRRRVQEWESLQNGEERKERKRAIRWMAPHYQAGTRRMRLAKVYEVDEEKALPENPRSALRRHRLTKVSEAEEDVASPESMESEQAKSEIQVFIEGLDVGLPPMTTEAPQLKSCLKKPAPDEGACMSPTAKF